MHTILENSHVLNGKRLWLKLSWRYKATVLNYIMIFLRLKPEQEQILTQAFPQTPYMQMKIHTIARISHGFSRNQTSIHFNGVYNWRQGGVLGGAKRKVIGCVTCDEPITVQIEPAKVRRRKRFSPEIAHFYPKKKN